MNEVDALIHVSHGMSGKVGNDRKLTEILPPNYSPVLKFKINLLHLELINFI